MKSLIYFLAFLTAGLLVSSCSVSPEEYQGESPRFDMADYFNGNLNAWGIFQDYRGKVTKRFQVKMTGTWNGNNGVLDELFSYADGSTQRRTWKLTKLSDNQFIGSAGDVVGVAKGIARGNALRWRYTMALEVDNDVYNVQFDDWMYMLDKDTVINRSFMKKFGITVGEVTLVFHRDNKLTGKSVTDQIPDGYVPGNSAANNSHSIHRAPQTDQARDTADPFSVAEVDDK